MLFHSIIVLVQLKNENSTTCRALLVFVSSKKTNTKNIGSDLFINVLNDQKPNFSCSAEKGNLPPKKNFALMQSTKF